MKQTGSKRKLQAMATREKIFNAAVALVEEKGIDGFTIDDIQERTGCSRGLFYNYFRSIHDIQSEIFITNEGQYEIICEQHLSGTRGMDKILLFTQYVAALHGKSGHKNALRVHYMNLLRSADRRRHVSDENRLVYVILKDALSECREDGKLVVGTDIRRAALDIMVILRGAILEYLLDESATGSDLVSRTARLTAAFLAGIHIGGIRIAVPPIGEIDMPALTSLEYFFSAREEKKREKEAAEEAKGED